MLDVSCGGIADVVAVDVKELMVIEGLATGSLLGAGIGYTMKIQYIENDPTQNVEWLSTGGT